MAQQHDHDDGDGAITPEVVAGPALFALESAEIDMQIATAQKWPRPAPEKIVRDIEAYALMNEETAASCFYVLKRKEKNSDEEKLIFGPSVRLAEIAFSSFRNLRGATRIVENDGRKITAQGACLDLQNNVAWSGTTDRNILSRSGKTFSNDMQIVTANAAQAIAGRNAIFKIIPGAIWQPVYEKCKRMAAGEGPIEKRFEKAAKFFSAFGITPAMLLAWLDKPGVKLVELVDEDIASLRGLVTSLRDQTTSIPKEFGDINPDGTLKNKPNGVDTPNMKAKAEAVNTAAAETKYQTSDTKSTDPETKTGEEETKPVQHEVKNHTDPPLFRNEQENGEPPGIRRARPPVRPIGS